MKNYERSFPCSCCGFLTLSEGTHETFEICPVCNWEDDDVQFNNPDFPGGANQENLNEARGNYKKIWNICPKIYKSCSSPTY